MNEIGKLIDFGTSLSDAGTGGAVLALCGGSVCDVFLLLL